VLSCGLICMFQTALRVYPARSPASLLPVTSPDRSLVTVGWHTFRHSFATILKSHGEDVKTVQELMRHANSSVTLNLYAQAVTDIKRSAQSKVARLIFAGTTPLESEESLLDGFGPAGFFGTSLSP
jgi:hypothetical protein